MIGQVLEKTHGYAIEKHRIYIDSKNVYVNVNTTSLYGIVRLFNISLHLIGLLNEKFSNESARKYITHWTSPVK